MFTHPFESLLLASADGQVMTTAERKIIFVNEAFCQYFDKTVSDLTGTHLFDWLRLMDSDAIQIWEENEVLAYDKGPRSNIDFRMQNDTSERCFNVSITLTEQQNQDGYLYLSAWHDITARRMAKEKLEHDYYDLQERETLVSALLTCANSAMETRNFKKAAQKIFESCKEIIGTTSGHVALLNRAGDENEVLYLDAGKDICTVDATLPMPIRGLRERAYKTGEVVYDNSFHNSDWMKLMPAGHIPLENVMFAPMVVNGDTVGLLGIGNKPGGFTDHDAQWAAAFGQLAAMSLMNTRMFDRLMHSEKRYRLLTESASDSIISINPRGKIISANKTFTKMFGYTEEELIRQPISMIIPERFRDQHLAGIQRLLHTGKSKIIGQTVELTGIRKGGMEFPIELSLSMWETEDGKYFSGIIRDITNRKKTEQALLHSQERLQESQTMAQLGQWELNLQDNELIWSDSIYELFEIDKNKFNASYEGFMAAVHPDDRDAVDQAYKKSVQDKMPYHIVHRLLMKDGRTKFVNEICRTEYDEDGQPVRSFGTVQDITELTYAEEAVRKSEEKFRLLSTMSPVGIYQIDMQGRCDYVNPQWYQMTGMTVQEAMGDGWLTAVFPEDRALVKAAYDQQADVAGIWRKEYRIQHTDGSIMWVHGVISPITDDTGCVVSYLGVNTDITERKLAEKEIADSLKEKEVLLKEIHHRVKNNMQIITNLLTLQARRIEDPKLRDVYRDSQNRIEAMSLIHETLYRSDSLARIDCQQYIERLVTYINRAYNNAAQNIRYHIQAKPLELTVDDAIPLGLIVSELLSNACKYAFPDRDEGDIHITMQSTDEKSVELTIVDNGVGLPKSYEGELHKTLGMQLISDLVTGQLKGELSIQNHNGTQFSIRFNRASVAVKGNTDAA